MFNRSPMGKYHVMVCATTPCMLCGADSIFQALKTHMGVSGYGQTTRVRLDAYYFLLGNSCSAGASAI